MDAEDKGLVRQVVGLLHYVQGDYKLAQFTQRGIATEVDNATHMTLTRLKHLVRYLVDCLDQVTVIEPDGSQDTIDIYMDSDWAGERQQRKSIDCIVVFVGGVVLHMSSKGQGAQSQSSAESELGGVHRSALFGIGVQN